MQPAGKRQPTNQISRGTDVLTLTVNLDGVETVYTYSDLDVKAVRNDLYAPAWKDLPPHTRDHLIASGHDEVSWNAMDAGTRGVMDWVRGAFTGKVNNCKSRMVRPDGEHIQKLYADPTVESIPANQDALIELIISRPDYKDRAARGLKTTLTPITTQ